MFDFISPKDYSDVYMNLCLGIVLLTIFHSYVLNLYDSKNVSFINVTGYLLLVFLILYIGTRSIDGVFGDTVNYNKSFEKYTLGGAINDNEADYGWHVFMKFMAQFMNIQWFFTICAFIYIYPLYKISKNLFNQYWYYAFLMFVVSFSFFTYGVNGVRNGAALSIFLWGLCYRKNKIIMSMFFFIAILFHKTALLPILAYVATFFYNNPKVYFKAWLVSIPLSLLLGSIFITLFTSLGFGDDRLNAYLTTSDAEAFASTGFRWDFLFHSAFVVFAGWYFIYKKKFKDTFYYQLLNTYLICNGFWILVIKANYSNRFAYLSWFMMALVIVYPFLKQTFFKYQYIILGNVILMYFGFTYFMNYIYYAYIR
ncbi:EpsG-like putative glucosyltransferase [Mariniflexile fucanivorans]|uniref:EpsG-like putative glucosyltransferase n=1 Tax=Mariniflexile fucanivorans TaxID=264023 RepID=A0A4R1RGE5_9FLAO|nr:EpsG family protein [Mariniflexile fucanivorans]TCL65016.1 EpsG-like putative glucosyltransferase [Mariniflexile fucanivorans]